MTRPPGPVSVFVNAFRMPMVSVDDSNGRSCEPSSSGLLNIEPFMTSNGRA
jgi:hypothetical protein